MVASWAVVLYVVTVMEYDVNVDVTAAMMTPKLPLWIRADASSEEASISGSDRLSKKSAVDGAALASNLSMECDGIIVRVDCFFLFRHGELVEERVMGFPEIVHGASPRKACWKPLLTT